MKKTSTLLLIITFVFPNIIFSQVTDENIWNSTDVLDQDKRIINQKKEIYLRDEILIKDDDGDATTIDPNYYTGYDNSTLTFQFQVSKKLRKYLDHNSFEFHYMKRFKNYWYGGFISRLLTEFGEISENKDHQPLFQGGKPKDLNVEITSIGFGLGLRYRFLFNFAKSDKFFETTNAFITYNLLTEKRSELDPAVIPNMDSYDDQNYAGFGLRADYGLMFRATKSMTFGLKAAFHISQLKRNRLTELEDENNTELITSWTSLGVELGFVY